MKNDTKKTEEKTKSKDERMVDYIRSLNAVEEELKLLREHKKDLRESYVSNNWLDKDEIKVLTKAWRLFKDEIDVDQLQSVYETVSEGLK